MLQPTQGRLTMKIQRRLILGVASLAALHSGYGLALGLGDLHLQSALNQPLAATIELRDVAGIGPGDIRASLASAEAFERAGIERPFFLTDLRRSEEHTSELQSRPHLVCRLLLEKKKL